MPITVIFHYICYSQGSLLPVACLGIFSVLRPMSGSKVETEETFKRFSLLKTNKTSLGWSGEELGWLQQGEREHWYFKPHLSSATFPLPPVAGKITRNQGRRKEVRAHSNLPFFPFERFEQWDN